MSSDSQSHKTSSPSSSAKNHLIADSLLLLTALLWGTNILVFKHAIGGTDGYAFNALRLVFAAFTLGFMAIIEWILWPKARTPRSSVPWGRVLLFSFLVGIVYQLFFVEGISRTTAGNISLIFASLPVWSALLSIVFLAERLPRIAWLGLLTTMIGTVVVIASGSEEVHFSSQTFLGNVLALIATAVWAGGSVLSRGLMSAMTPIQLAAISSLLTTPVHILIASRQLPAALEEATQPAYLGAMIYSGVCSTGIAYATWNAGVRLVGASYASVYQNVVTLVAVGGGWLFLAEDVLAVQIVGGMMTIGGLLLMRRGRPKSVFQKGV